APKTSRSSISWRASGSVLDPTLARVHGPATAGELFVAFEPIASTQLRRIERVVRRLEQREGARKSMLGGVGRNPDRGRNPHALGGFAVIARRVCAGPPLRDLLRDFSSGAWQHHHELLAAESGHEIAAAHARLKHSGAISQHFVPDLRAEAFVHVLEVIQ